MASVNTNVAGTAGVFQSPFAMISPPDYSKRRAMFLEDRSLTKAAFGVCL